jgi:cell division topological specificity factor
MFESIINFFKKLSKKDKQQESSNTAKERLHLVLMQDRANVSADFLELMRQEIIEVIKKYIDIDEGAIDVKLTNKANEDGTVGAPALYANIPIITIKNEAKKANVKENEPSSKESKKEEKEEKASKEAVQEESSEKEEQTEKEEKQEVVEEQKENIEIKQEESKKQEEKQEEKKEAVKEEESKTKQEEKKEEVKQAEKKEIKKPSNNR